ncbi:MAG: D-arabinono-1,4-lactone oxidase [Hyphomicrobiaceae bacterium]
MAEAWTNWVGNQSFTPAERAVARDEMHAVALIQDAVRRGIGVRTAGSGHSFTPVVETAGLNLDIAALNGVIGVDRGRHRVTLGAAARIGDLGEPLWQHGLGLANQGDIDAQTIAGAVATATHGSGRDLQCFSAGLVGCRLVTGTGEVLDLDLGSDTDLMHAAQTSIGLLGIMTRLTIKVVPAYTLHERIEIMHIDEVLARWDELLDGYRHFSFFWMPTDESYRLYGLSPAKRDTCYVKLYNEPSEAAGTPVLAVNERIDRSYRIYPGEFQPNFHELEYFMPVEYGREVVRRQRELMIERAPESAFPMEVRFVKADDAWLSPNYRRDSIVISVSGIPGTDYWPYLEASDAVFAEFAGRPHWGKLHFMTARRMADLFPEYARFAALRRRLDPKGLFLNPHFRSMFPD